MAESNTSTTSPLSTPPASVRDSSTADHEEPPLAQRIPTMGMDDLMALLTTGQVQPGSPEFQLVEQRQKHNLKPYKKPFPQQIEAAGALTAKAYGAYWVRYTLKDSHGVVRQHLRPFLAIQRLPDDPPLLNGMPGLQAMNVLLRPGSTTWQYSFFKNGKPRIKIDTPKQFRKHLRKNLKVYAILATPPHLIGNPGPENHNQLPPAIQNYDDVFAEEKAAAL